MIHEHELVERFREKLNTRKNTQEDVALIQKKYRNSAILQYYLGVYYELEFMIGKAEKTFLRCIELDQSFSEPYFRLAELYYIADLFPSYERILLRLLKHTKHVSDSLKICHILCEQYCKRFEYEKAIRLYNQAFHHIVKDHQSSFEASITFLQGGHPENTQKFIDVYKDKYPLIANYVKMHMISYIHEDQTINVPTKICGTDKIRVGLYSSLLYSCWIQDLIRPYIESMNTSTFDVFVFYDNDIYDKNTKEWMNINQNGWRPIYGQTNDTIIDMINDMHIDVFIWLDPWYISTKRLPILEAINHVIKACAIHPSPCNSKNIIKLPYLHIDYMEKHNNKQTENTLLQLGVFDHSSVLHPQLLEVWKRVFSQRTDVCLVVFLEKGQHYVPWARNIPNVRYIKYTENIKEPLVSLHALLEPFPCHETPIVHIAKMLGIHILSKTYRTWMDYEQYLLTWTPSCKTDTCALERKVTIHDIEHQICHVVSNVKQTHRIVNNREKPRVRTMGGHLPHSSYYDIVTQNEDVIYCDPHILEMLFRQNTPFDQFVTPIVSYATPDLLQHFGVRIVSLCKTDRLRLLVPSEYVKTQIKNNMKIDTYYVPSGDLFLLGKAFAMHSCQNIISGEAFMHHLIVTYGEYKIHAHNTIEIMPFDMSLSIVFLSSSNIREFITDVLPFTSKPFIFVTHNSDDNIIYNVHEYQHLCAHPKVIKWFTHNNCFQHPKIHGLPIGLANSGWEHGNMRIFSNFVSRNKNKIKTKLCYLGSDIKTNKKERGATKCLQEYYTWQNQMLDYESYLALLSEFQYCICPEGKGVDTHRFWESLYLGTIPVVRRGDHPEWVDYWQQKVPMVVVNDWSHATPEFLEKQIVRYPSDWRSFLSMSHYLDVIDSFLH